MVRLPKASRIIVRFDPLSQLDTGDFLKIYTKGTKAVLFWAVSGVLCCASWS